MSQIFPYRSWGELRRANSRSTQTQNDVYVRDELRSDDFLLRENRVNLGPNYQYRKEYADFIPEFPMNYGTPDMWGWENWVKERKITTSTPHPKAPQLYTRTTTDAFYRGCSTCRNPRKF
jgi:hypothetical protein